MKKIKDRILPIVFVLIIFLGFFGTAITKGKVIVWNVVKNSDAYRSDDTFSGKLHSYISAFDGAVNDNIFLKNQYIDLFGVLQNVMQKDVIPSKGFTGTIVRGSDNKLYTASSVTTEKSDTEDLSDIEEYANALTALNKTVKDSGGELLYVQAPQKYHDDVKVPVSIDAQHLNVRKDALLEQIRGKVDCIDAEQGLRERGIDENAMFFATDHHWTVDSAFGCYQEICDYLNENTDFSIEKTYYDSENWNREELKDAYLGSTGVRVGRYYVGRDDFSLYTPKFDTDFERHYLSTETEESEGDFAHCVLTRYDSLIGGDYSNLTWSIYTGADTSYVSIVNKDTDSDKKVLVVKDSFGLPVCAFMSTVCQELDIYDMRYSHESSLNQFIQNENFDLVLFVYNPEALSSTFFDFDQ